MYICFYLCQTLTSMPECSQTPRRQRPDYLAEFTSGSSTDNSCSYSDDEEEDRRKARGGGRGGDKREKKVSYDLGESKEKNLAERSGKVARVISEHLPKSSLLTWSLVNLRSLTLYFKFVIWLSCSSTPCFPLVSYIVFVCTS